MSLPVPNAPTIVDFINVGLAEASLRQPQLSFFAGDVSTFYLQAMAAMCEHLSAYAKGRFRATYLDGAQGDDLTYLANDHWNVRRLPPVQASGIAIFTRVTASLGAGQLASGSVYSTVPDFQGNTIQYTLDSNVSFQALDLQHTGSVTAIVPGPAGNISSGSLATVVTTAFDSTIVVSNTGTFAGGTDKEQDPPLRNRVRSVPNTLAKATLSALQYGAIQTVNAGVTTATVIEQTTGAGVITGLVQVYVSDDNGNSSPTMVSLVQTEMDNWRAAGTVVNVYGGSVYILTGITVTLTTRPGFNKTAMTSTIQQAVVAAVGRLFIGDTLNTDIIKQAVINIDSNNILGVAVGGIASTVVPAANQLLRTTAANVQVI